jgi:hypothetical protein
MSTLRKPAPAKNVKLERLFANVEGIYSLGQSQRHSSSVEHDGKCQDNDALKASSKMQQKKTDRKNVANYAIIGRATCLEEFLTSRVLL